MAEIHPFRAYRYDTSRVALQDVLTQPYDKITPAMQDLYYGASPYNLITVEKGRTYAEDSPTSNVYTRAEQTINQWIAEKILVQEGAPSIYIYSQDFLLPDRQTRRLRIGFIALGRVEDYEAKVVFRHERTLSAPKADRIELLRHTRAQTGQLFLLYDDPSRKIDNWLERLSKERPPLQLSDEYGVTHRLWPVSDRNFIQKIQAEMANKKLVIADGHHRYETALHLRNEGRALAGRTDPLAASEFAMMTFINTHSKGLVILPTHRIVSNLAKFDPEQFRQAIAPYFDWYSYPFASSEARASSYDDFRKDLEGTNHGRRAIGVYMGGDAFYLFLLKKEAEADLEALLPKASEAQRGLDLVLLHQFILGRILGITGEAVAAEKNVGYEREMDAAIAAVDHQQAQIAFLLKPVRVQQVMDIALEGDVLPQKSTDFYPKLLSGVAIYRAEGHVES
jgi:uncharacterized protein (DUF1015 family)